MEKSTMDEKGASPPEREIRVLEIVGCFLMFFGILLLIGVDKAETTGGKVTNLVSAAILLSIGGGMFLRGVIRHQGGWLLPLVLFTSLAVVAGVVAFCLSPSSLEMRGRAYDTLVGALTWAGWQMRDVVASIAPEQVNVFTVFGFVVIAAVVWLVRRKTVFEGVTV